MCKNKLFLAALFMASMCMMTSCGGPKKLVQRIIPKAVSTINSVGLSELNLKHGTDYTIMNTVSADATILYTEQRKGQQVTITEENNEFKLVYTYDSEQENWYLTDFEGIARFGFLSNDEGRTSLREVNPESVARNYAIYKIINASKVRGADGVIEPVISTNVEQKGKTIAFKTTVSAKLIKLKTDTK